MKKHNTNKSNTKPNTSNLSKEEIQRRKKIKDELELDAEFSIWQIDAIKGNKEALEFLRSVFPDKTNYWELTVFDIAYMRHHIIPVLGMD